MRPRSDGLAGVERPRAEAGTNGGREPKTPPTASAPQRTAPPNEAAPPSEPAPSSLQRNDAPNRRHHALPGPVSRAVGGVDPGSRPRSRPCRAPRARSAHVGPRPASERRRLSVRRRRRDGAAADRSRMLWMRSRRTAPRRRGSCSIPAAGPSTSSSLATSQPGRGWSSSRRVTRAWMSVFGRSSISSCRSATTSSRGGSCRRWW